MILPRPRRCFSVSSPRLRRGSILLRGQLSSSFYTDSHCAGKRLGTLDASVTRAARAAPFASGEQRQRAGGQAGKWRAKSPRRSKGERGEGRGEREEAPWRISLLLPCSSTNLLLGSLASLAPPLDLLEQGSWCCGVWGRWLGGWVVVGGFLRSSSFVLRSSFFVLVRTWAAQQLSGALVPTKGHQTGSNEEISGSGRGQACRRAPPACFLRDPRYSLRDGLMEEV